MNIRTMRKLERLGWPKDWLIDVKHNFHPKKQGKYRIKIYSIDDLGDTPEDGDLLDTTCFSNDLELSIIHHFFEGQAYVMTVVETGEEIGRGIIDGAPFEEVEEYENTGVEWDWRMSEVRDLIAKQIAEEDAKPSGYIRKRKKKTYDGECNNG